MRILVTGGAGFIGAHVVHHLVRLGADVGVLDDFSTGRRAALDPALRAGLRGADVLTGDVCGPAVEATLLRWRPEVLVHLAAQARVVESVHDPLRDARVNVLGTVRLLTAAHHAGVRRVVFAASGGAMYGEPAGPRHRLTESTPPAPVSPYGLSKAAADSYVRLFGDLYGLPSVRLALGNVYGPGCGGGPGAGVVARFVTDLLAGRSPTIAGDGRQTRDFVHVHDVAEAFTLACGGPDGALVNIGTGVATSVLDVLGIVADLLGVQPDPVHVADRPGELRHNCLDITRARQVLGWAPRRLLRDGVADLISRLRPGRAAQRFPLTRAADARVSKGGE